MTHQRRLAATCALSAAAVAAAVSASAPTMAATQSGALRPLAADAASASGAQIATAAPRWTALFDTTTGWTGADGIYSAPISGDERPGSTTGRDRTYFTFSDTFVGGVSPSGTRLPGTTLVNNTTAVLVGGRPKPARMHFFVNRQPDGDPVAQVVPDTEDQWFWPGDVIAIDDTMYEFSLRMKEGSGGVFNFAVDGISLLTTDATSAPPFEEYTQVETPLFVPASGSRGEITFGQALMPNTADAGAPNPDGFLYVYGTESGVTKRLVAARVRPADIENFSAYEYWDGAGWVASPAAAIGTAPRLSTEFSVTPLADGRFILVNLLGGFRGEVGVRYADTPVGPWSAPTVIWTAPEEELTPNAYTYNAKAHPSLSTPGSLLISYNVNTFEFGEHFSNADIYRPRFIKLAL